MVWNGCILLHSALRADVDVSRVTLCLKPKAHPLLNGDAPFFESGFIVCVFLCCAVLGEGDGLDRQYALQRWRQIPESKNYPPQFAKLSKY